MSLIIAIENDNEILIGSDSLILIKDKDGEIRGQSLTKVTKINQHLSIAITGTTLNVTLHIFEKYFAELSNITHFDTAFETLCQKIHDTTFVINTNEQYRVSVFGFNGDNPKIKSIEIHAGKITATDETDTNLYFCGEDEPVNLAENLLAGKTIGSTSEQITFAITDTITTCITKYPNVLSEPIHIIKIQTPSI